MDERMNLVDVAGASLTLLGAVVESYIKSGYCDPMMRQALIGAEELARHFQASVAENYEHHHDDDLVKGVNDLVTNLQVTIMEAGEVMNNIIRENDLPVKENTFEIDTDHPNFRPEDHTDCDCLDKGEDED